MIRVLALLVASGAVLASSGCTGTSEPARLLERYVELHRAGDVDGLLALHADDAEFLIPGQAPIQGREALRDLFEWDEVLESELILEEMQVQGDTISIERLAERNLFFKALGVPEVHYEPGTRFVMRDGVVAGVYPTRFTAETEARLSERFSTLVNWLGAERPREQAHLLPGGQFRYDGASARLWLQVLADWNKLKG